MNYQEALEKVNQAQKIVHHGRVRTLADNMFDRTAEILRDEKPGLVEYKYIPFGAYDLRVKLFSHKHYFFLVQFINNFEFTGHKAEQVDCSSLSIYLVTRPWTDKEAEDFSKYLNDGCIQVCYMKKMMDGSWKSGSYCLVADWYAVYLDALSLEEAAVQDKKAKVLLDEQAPLFNLIDRWNSLRGSDPYTKGE